MLYKEINKQHRSCCVACSGGKIKQKKNDILSCKGDGDYGKAKTWTDTVNGLYKNTHEAFNNTGQTVTYQNIAGVDCITIVPGDIQTVSMAIGTNIFNMQRDMDVNIKNFRHPLAMVTCEMVQTGFLYGYSIYVPCC